jgi:hypothetical protein
MVPLAMVLGTVLGAAIYGYCRQAFPKLDDQAAGAVAVLAGLGGVVAFAVILFPTQVTAGFDSDWFVLGFRNREFAAAFYECNRDVARME